MAAPNSSDCRLSPDEIFGGLTEPAVAVLPPPSSFGYFRAGGPSTTGRSLRTTLALPNQKNMGTALRGAALQVSGRCPPRASPAPEKLHSFSELLTAPPWSSSAPNRVAHDP
eukprot:TRINITY_DN97899_c0_g1_i1.p1 TRINITY_DN97899_c0_g1~~TRINITY_DN97899_c0_g1_i1.p1  ORF type:complete len:119 (+),score=0.28 TRINITY_DN97899_c0_g1_i1:24-359(+)